MAEGEALRSRRSRQHRRGDHTLCRSEPEDPRARRCPDAGQNLQPPRVLGAVYQRSKRHAQGDHSGCSWRCPDSGIPRPAPKRVPCSRTAGRSTTSCRWSTAARIPGTTCGSCADGATRPDASTRGMGSTPCPRTGLLHLGRSRSGRNAGSVCTKRTPGRSAARAANAGHAGGGTSSRPAAAAPGSRSRRSRNDGNRNRSDWSKHGGSGSSRSSRPDPAGVAAPPSLRSDPTNRPVEPTSARVTAAASNSPTGSIPARASGHGVAARPTSISGTGRGRSCVPAGSAGTPDSPSAEAARSPHAYHGET